ncbi:terpene synthase family protein [Sinosporangium siamense]|uniref:Terpene synthase n=1 Tax=Sinosporangium siamense TaxID=1367973 RepID=A0A919RLN4_9ACTN|nr:hypothetical protein [Sinosporangium siamense]GII96058.1 hypothetical protein Ssi02_62890 [Sinosporangium siamense]
MSAKDHLDQATITVDLPHRTNPELTRAREHVREWCLSYGFMNSTTTARRFTDADPAKIVCYAYPEARGADLDVALDMMCFFAALDDCFESAFWRSPADGIPFIRTLTSLLHEDLPPASLSPIAAAFADMWRRSTAGMSSAWKTRAAHHWNQYMWAYISEATSRKRGFEPDLDSYLAMRRPVSGIQCCFDMLERTNHYEVPAQSWFHAHLRRLADLAMDICILCNDLASVTRDEVRGDTSNAVLVLMAHNLGRKAAERKVRKTISQLVEEFRTAHRRTRRLCEQLRLDEPGRRDTLRWTDELLEFAGANLAWQGEVARYGEASAPLADAHHMAALAHQSG